MEDLGFKLALVGAVGIGAQWLAWRFRLPAIVLLLLGGVTIGPITGLVNPVEDFGSLLRPLVALAVAVILFEGGLTLNLGEIKHTSVAVRRLVVVGAPLAWLLGTLAAHYVAGLSWPAAVVLAGIFVVTGPTVIMPLLRNARLSNRPASLLRWEAIVNDPVGALFAVLAYEYILVSQLGRASDGVVLQFVLALAISLAGGFLLGKAIVAVFNRGLAPEYLKAPILFAAVLCAYVASQMVLEESGLLTVTVMGLTIGNSKLTSLDEILRFKETMTVILVSGVFVLLTATIDQNILNALSWRSVAFIGVMLFLVRPLTIWISTIGAGLTWQERLLVGWIAPRGVVAVAVATHFASLMGDISLSGGREMIALTFALVFTTVVLHGFTIAPLARWLGLAAKDGDGVLIVGASAWSTALAGKLKTQGVQVMIADQNWGHLRGAREEGVETYYGDILSEAAEHTAGLNRFTHLLAATDNAAYNRLVCSDFAYEFGRNNVLLLPSADGVRDHGEQAGMAGCPAFQPSSTYGQLNDLLSQGARFYASKLTEKFSLSDFHQTQEGQRQLMLAIRSDGRISFAEPGKQLTAQTNETLISFG